MKRTLLVITFFISGMLAKAQFATQDNSTVLWYSRIQITNSPGNTATTRRNAYDLPDSGRLYRLHTRLQLDTVALWPANNGSDKVMVMNDSGLVNYSTNFFTKAQSDARYLQSVPAQSFASLTGKPTTYAGYGITDVYPLTGNPSNFLTSINSAQVTTALGYTPYNGTTNPNGYINGITGTMVNTALGYTAYNGITNPLGFLTTVSSAQIAAALGYTPANAARTLTINGVTFDLTANRSWSVGTLIGTDTASLSNRINAKFTTPSGTTAQYVRGDGTLATLLTAVSGLYGLPDYTNTVATVADSAVFFLTSDKTASGTALYTTINYVNPLVNDVNGNYTFGWTISADKKRLVVKSRVATNTAVIAILGISVLNSTVPVVTGTQIQVNVKGI
jgi:hypothetical protein